MDSRTNVREAQKRIVDSLVQCESSIAQLYATYSTAVPGMADFWLALSSAEETHARLLKSMHRLIDRGNTLFNLGRFDINTIDTFATQVAAELVVAKAGPVTALHAIAVAVSFEMSILDAHFYEVVTSDAPEFVIMADHLSKDTKHHVGLIRDRHIALLHAQLRKA